MSYSKEIKLKEKNYTEKTFDSNYMEIIQCLLF